MIDIRVISIVIYIVNTNGKHLERMVDCIWRMSDTIINLKENK